MGGSAALGHSRPMRRTLLALTVSLAGLAAAGTPAHAQTGAAVPILNSAFGAAKVDILAGETVTWHNDSVRPHTVNADDGSWSSPRLLATSGFDRRFDAPGAFGYYCQLHPTMRGEVDVHRLLLDAPRDPAGAGKPYILTGRAALPAGTEVGIQTEVGASAATAKVADDGTFKATVKPAETTSYHAVAEGESTPPVQVLVLDRKVSASAAVAKRKMTVTAQVAPASKGATVVLQLRLKEHFGWWPVRTAKLDASSRARFTLARGRSVAARVLLTASDGATELARSATFHVR